MAQKKKKTSYYAEMQGAVNNLPKSDTKDLVKLMEKMQKEEKSQNQLYTSEMQGAVNNLTKTDPLQKEMQTQKEIMDYRTSNMDLYKQTQKIESGKSSILEQAKYKAKKRYADKERGDYNQLADEIHGLYSGYTKYAKGDTYDIKGISDQIKNADDILKKLELHKKYTAIYDKNNYENIKSLYDEISSAKSHLVNVKDNMSKYKNENEYNIARTYSNFSSYDELKKTEYELIKQKEEMQRVGGFDRQIADINKRLNYINENGYNSVILGQMSSSQHDELLNRIEHLFNLAADDKEKYKSTAYIDKFYADAKKRGLSDDEARAEFQKAEKQASDNYLKLKRQYDNISEFRREVKIQEDIDEKWRGLVSDNDNAEVKHKQGKSGNDHDKFAYDAVNYGYVPKNYDFPEHKNLRYDGSQSDIAINDYIKTSQEYYRKLTLMNSEQKLMYNRIYNKYGAEKASEYLNDIDNQLNKLYIGEVKKEAKDVANEYPILSTLYNVGSSVPRAVKSLANNAENIMMAISGEEIDPYDMRFADTYMSEALYSGVKDQIDSPFWKVAYSAGTQAAELALNMMVSGGLGKVAGAFSSTQKAAEISSKVANVANQVLLSSKSMEDTTLKYLESGKSPLTAVGMGMISGAIEAWTERKSMANILKSPDIFSEAGRMAAIKAWSKKVGLDAVSEGWEEVESNLYNTIAAFIFNQRDNDNFIKAYDNAIANGLTSGKAFLYAAETVLPEYIESFAAGALAGGMFSGFNTASVIKTSNDVRDFTTQDFIVNNKPVDLTSISEFLVKNNIAEPEDAIKISEVIYKKVTGSGVTQSEEQMVRDNPTLRGIIYGLVDVYGVQNRKKFSETKSGKNTEEVSDLSQQKETKYKSELDRAIHQPTLSNKTIDSIIDNESARNEFYDLTGIRLNGTKAEMREDIKQWKLIEDYKRRQKENRGKKWISVEEATEKSKNAKSSEENGIDIDTSGINTAQILNDTNTDTSLATRGRASTREYLKAIDTTKSDSLISKIMKDGYSQEEATKIVDGIYSFMYARGRSGADFNESVAVVEKELWSNVRKEAAAFYEAGVEDSSKTLTPGKNGRLVYSSVVSKMLREKRIDHRTARAINTIAKKLGVQIHFVEDMDGEGEFNLKTGVLKINAKAKNKFFITSVHESIHALRSIDPESYNKIRDVVFEVLNQDSKVFSKAYNERLEKYRKDATDKDGNLNKDYIEEELNAKVISELLADPKFIKELAKVDRNLGQKIKDVLVDLFDKIFVRYKEDVTSSVDVKNAIDLLKSEFNTVKTMYENALKSTESMQMEEVSGEKITSAEDGEVMKSNNNNNYITAYMSDTERSTIISSKTIDAPLYEGQLDNIIKSNLNDLNSQKIGLVKKTIIAISEQFKVFGQSIRIEDVDVEVTLSKSNLKESISKKATPSELVKLIPILKLAVGNSIGIERHDNRYFFDSNTVYFENLLGGYVDGEYFIPVRFGLKHSNYDGTTLYVVVDQNKIPTKLLDTTKKTKVVKETIPQKTEKQTSRLVKYNVSQIIKYVKSKDLLRYIPDNMLSKEQKNAKWDAIAETIKITNNKNDEKYSNYVKTGNIQAALKMVTIAAKINGFTIKAYHGTSRADRVGTVFRPDRATSGPMAFFTDDKVIATNYARDKADTSLAYDEEYDSYYTQFRVNRNGKSISIPELWKYLSVSERNKIKAIAGQIKFDDDYENIIVDKSEKHGNGAYDDYTLNMHKGNALEALIDTWLETGDLYRREADFLEVLKLVGIEDAEYRDPDARHEKVYDVWLKIQKPFDTEMADKSFYDSLSDWIESHNMSVYKKETSNADMWDKNNQTPETWLEKLNDDIENGTTHAWTVIPDFVTDYLKEQKYDGIKDKGGKNGGDSHTVWIPFSSEQIKSAELVTYDDNGNVIPLSKRFNTENKDIRWSKGDTPTETESDETVEPLNLMPTTAQLKQSVFELKEKTRKKLEQQVEEYGAIKKGYNPSREVTLPKETDAGKVRTFQRTAIEADVVSNEAAAEIADSIANENLSSVYSVVSDRKVYRTARQLFETRGFDSMYNEWNALIESGKKIDKQDIANAMILVAEASKRGMIEEETHILAQLAVEATAGGHIVQAMSMLKKLGTSAMVYSVEKTIDKIGRQVEEKHGKKIIRPDELIGKYKNALEKEKKAGDGNTELSDKYLDEILQDVANQVPATWFDKWNAWRMFAMLGNVKTHGRNFIGNTLFWPVRFVRDLVSATGQTVFIRDVEKRTKSFKGQFRRGETLAFAKQDAKKIEEILRGETKYGDFSKIDQMRRIFKWNWLEKATKFNSKMLELEDWVFLRMHYARALTNYLTTQKVDINNISDEVMAKARIFAVKEAQKATFRDANIVAQFLRSSNKFSKGLGIAVDAVLPFTKTPMNVVKRGAEYSPAGFVQMLWKGLANIKSGKYSAAEFCDDLGEAFTGTGLMVIGYFLAQNGLLVGAGDDDSAENKWAKILGMQNYAFKIGDGTYTIDWLVPAGMPLFVGCEMYKLFSDSETSVGDFIEKFARVIEPVFETSMLQSLTDLIDSARYAQTGAEAAMDMFLGVPLSYIGQGVPTLLGQVSKTIDNTKRKTYSEKGLVPGFVQSFIQQQQKKIPGLSFLMEPYVNERGETEKNSEGNFVMRVLHNFLSPGYYKSNKSTSTDKELIRLYNIHHDTDIIPKTAPKSIKINGENYYLSNEQHSTYQSVMGKTYYEKAKEIMASDYYQSLSDDDKIALMKKVREYAEEKGRKEAIPNYRVKNGFVMSAMETVGGYRQLVDEEATEGFSKDNLSDDDYIKYDEQRGALFETIMSEIELPTDNDEFMDKYYENLKKFSEQVALESNSNGEFNVDIDWINEIKELTSEKQAEYIYGKTLKSMYDVNSLANAAINTNSNISPEIKLKLLSNVTVINKSPQDSYRERNLKAKGISEETWLDVYNKYNEFKEYKQGKDTVTKKEQIVAYINRLKISNSQKSDIYRALGFKDPKKAKDVLWNYVFDKTNPTDYSTALGRQVANLSGSAYKNDAAWGQCVWYARGRAKEKLSANIPAIGNANEMYANAKAGAKLEPTIGNIRPNTLVTYQIGTSRAGQKYGHVIYIEDVVGDTVYYTEGGYGNSSGTVKTTTKAGIMNGNDGKTGTNIIGIIDVTKY